MSKKLKHNTIMATCLEIPFDVHYSPKLSCPKPDDRDYIIANLSFPYGNSAKYCIYIEFKLKYSMVDNIKDTKIPKIKILDLILALRNLRVGSLGFDLLDLKWGYSSYRVISVPIGLKTGSALCQRTIDVIHHVVSAKGIQMYKHIKNEMCLHKNDKTSGEPLILQAFLYFYDFHQSKESHSTLSHFCEW